MVDWLIDRLIFFCNVDYDLEFPTEGTSDYVQLWGMPALTQFTVCFRMKTDKVNDGTPFSYSSSADDNDILFFDYTDFDFWVGGEKRYEFKRYNAIQC